MVFLRVRLEWLAGHSAAVDFDAEVLRQLSDLGGLFGPGPVERFAPGPCPDPDYPGTLSGVVHADTDAASGPAGSPGHVSCGAGHALRPRNRRRMVPTELAALAMGADEATIRKRASRVKLTRFGDSQRAECDLGELLALRR